MSHTTIELHQKFVFEIIPNEDHEVVHEELAREGWDRVASQSGTDYHLIRGCYFKKDGSKVEIDRVEARLRSRLNRPFSIELTVGPSYGYGLKPVVQPTLLSGLFSSPGTNPNAIYSSLADHLYPLKKIV